MWVDEMAAQLVDAMVRVTVAYLAVASVRQKVASTVSPTVGSLVVPLVPLLAFWMAV